jgi:predicted phage terminase large subunit-like protein
VLPVDNEALSIAIDREMVKRGGLLEFGKRAWHLVEPDREYLYNWHHDEICTHIAACVAGYRTDKLDARKMLIEVPPGSTKSLWCSIFLTPWIWTIRPGFCTINSSFDIDLSTQFARKALLILESDWYQKRWPDVRLRDNSASEKGFFNTRGGFRYATSTGSKVTGWHADLKVVDDPNKPADTQGSAAVTAIALENTKTWWHGTMSTRDKEPKNARYLIVMQRLHENDLAGHLEETDHPTILRLPMRFEKNNRCWNEGIGGDRRLFEGQLLWPERFDEETVSAKERELGIFASAQYQQNPINADGDVFKAVWFQTWHELPRISSFYLSVDCSFKSTAACDYVSIQVWGKFGPNYYLVHEVCDRLSFTETLKAIKQVLATYRCGPKLIEDKANGSAVIDVLRQQVSGLIPVNPAGGKIARARAVTYLHQAGNVFYPPDTRYPWVARHTTQLLGFPRAKNDDSVDAETQFLYYASQRGTAVFDAMQAVKARRH